MKSRLLVGTLALLMTLAAPTFAQDTGIVDTVDLELTVDTNAMTATLELWVFSDESIGGATVGFSWGDSPNPTHFAMDTAIAAAAAAGFDFGVFLYEGSSRATTNANYRFLFGGLSVVQFVPASATRRLWATYSFSITNWGGYSADGFLVDTLTFSPGSEYLFVNYDEGGDIYPYFTGSVSFGNVGTAAGDEDSDPELPKVYALSQNYPNPFNPTTEIAFDLPAASQVRLTVFNILGQEVATLVNAQRSAGHYVEQWDAGSQASGIYFYKLQAGNFTETRKMMLLK